MQPTHPDTPDDVVLRVKALFIEVTRTDITLPEIKLAKKELHQLVQKLEKPYSRSKDYWASLQKLVVCTESTTDMKIRAERIRTLGSMFFYFDAPDTFVTATAALILTSLTNSSGDVRESARHMISNWRIHHSSNKIKVSEPTKDFIKQLVSLIKANASTAETVSIEAMPPSVYKSLLLAYEEVVRGLYVEQWVSQNPELIIEIPTEDYTPVFNRATQIPLLWRRYPCEPATKTLAEQLTTSASIRLDFFLKQLGLTKSEINDIRSRIATAYTSPDQEQVVAKIADYIINQNRPLETLTPFIREFQTIMNHTARHDGSTWFTYVLLSVQTECTELKITKKINWNQWLSYVSTVHAEIDNFGQLFSAQEKTKYQSFQELLIQSKILTPEDLLQDLNDFDTSSRDALSIAHYICDWIIQTYPTYTTKEPRKFAALCLGAVYEINQGLTPYRPQHLADFGGWKGASSLLNTTRTIVRMLLQVVPDPDMFILQDSRDFFDEPISE